MRRIAISLLSTAGILASGFAAVAPVAASASATPGHRAATSTAGFAFSGINPCRAEDTRNDGKTLSSASTLNVTVAGGTVCTTVPASAVAVVANVTTTDTTGSGYITVYPAGATQPTASNQNFGPGATIAAQVTTAVGTAGQITIYNFFGSANVIVDITGYYAAPTANSLGRFTPVSPYRAADTRNTFQTLMPNSSTDFQIAGLGIPAIGVQAAVLNFTVTNTQAPGFLTVIPKGATAATSSILNWGTGQTIPNRVDALLGSAGFITVFNGSSGSTDLVIDVNGYFTDSSSGAGTGSLFQPLPAPVRLLDTRTTGGPIAGNSLRGLNVSGSNGIPANATAVVQNLTVTNTAGNSYLSAFPNSRPLASDDNWVAGLTIANAATTGLNSVGGENFYNLNGNVDLVVDASGYYTPSPGVLVTANPASVPADKVSQSSIVATVTDQNGNAIAGDPVQFTLTGAACTGATQNAAISGASAATSASGQATATFTSADTVGTCTVNVLESRNGQTGSVAISQTAVKNTVGVAAASAKVPADGSTTDLITTTVLGGVAPNSPVNNDAVTYTLTPNPAGACGTLSVSSGTTNAAGQTTTTYTPSTTVGFCKIAATEAATGGTGSTTVTQTVNPSPTNVLAVGSTVNPVVADGSSTSSITATVTNTGTPVASDLVHFSLGTANPSGACGTLSATDVNTNGSGVATVTYTASTIAGSCPISAIEANGGASGSLAPASRTVADAVTNGTTTVTSATAAFGVADLNRGVSGTNIPIGTIISVVTNATTVTISNAATGTSAAGSLTITGGEAQTVAPHQVSVTANPSSLPADGSSKSTITAVDRTVSGAAVSGAVVTFTPTGTCGTLSSATGTTNSSGVATTTYTAAAASGFCNIAAAEGGGTSTTTVTQTNAGAGTATLTASKTTVPADAGATTSTLTVTVKNAAGNPIAGDAVNFAKSGTPSAACGTITAISGGGATNASGQVTATYNSSSTAGSCAITATEASAGLSASQTITQTAPANVVAVAGCTAGMPVIAANCTGGNSDTQSANGVNTKSFRVNVTKLVGGTAVSGDTVTAALVGNPASVCSSTSLDKTTTTTNAAGDAFFTYTYSTVVGFCKITFTETAAGGTASANIDQTVNPTPAGDTVMVTNLPDPVVGNGTSTETLTATVRTAGAVAIVNDQVQFILTGASCGTLSSQYATTNASGVATVTYTSKANVSAVTTMCSYTAQEANGGTTSAAGTINQTAQPRNVVVTSSAATLASNSGATATVTATVTDANGTPVAEAGNFTLVANPGTACTILPVSGTANPTNASGQATAVVTAGTTSGFCNVTYTNTAVGGSGTVQIRIS